MSKKLLKQVKVFLLLITGFLAATLVFKRNQLERYLVNVASSEKQRSAESELFESLFIDQLINENLRYPACQNLEDAQSRIELMELSLGNIDSIYNQIDVNSAVIQDGLLVLAYSYHKRVDTAFAYYKNNTTKQEKLGTLIIPGSGINESIKIAENLGTYQQEIDDCLVHYSDVFILIKPNEGILAIHNGKAKLGGQSYLNHLVNTGSGYSGYYLLQSLAISKYLKQKYCKAGVSGLSQGGLASLYVGLLGGLDFAIVASGYTEHMKNPYPSGHDQILTPDFNWHYRPKLIRQRIMEAKGNFLFSYGLHDNTLYQLEYETRLTERHLELPNTYFRYHKGHHQYDTNSIASFLNQIPINTCVD